MPSWGVLGLSMSVCGCGPGWAVDLQACAGPVLVLEYTSFAFWVAADQVN
tara:strand:- start:158 stop:307 length:150 start_codon:yes stop_codon:yes gene_type:complete